MIKLWKKYLQYKEKRKFVFIGTVIAETFMLKDNKRTGEQYIWYYHLSENGYGKRSYCVTGDTRKGECYYSQEAHKVHAEVVAWNMGGRLPSGIDRHFKNTRPKAQLVPIKGGRND